MTIEHRGFVNAMAALRWAFRTVPDPRSILVTGCSAGSVGSAALAPYVIRHYPRARVAQLGDSLAFVFDRPLDLSDLRAYANMPRWLPAVRALRPREHRWPTTTWRSPGTTPRGSDHCVLPVETFYSLRRAGSAVRDRTARLAAGQPVADGG